MSYQMGQSEFDRYDYETFSKYVLESQKTIDRISHILKGEVLTTQEITQNGQKIIIPAWEKRGKAHMNDEGVNFVIRILSLLMDKTIASSNLKEYTANQMAKNSMDALGYVFYENLHNGNTFGFEDVQQLNALLDYLNNIILAQIHRAVGMGTLKQLQTNHSVIEQRRTSDKKDEYEERPNMAF